MPPSQSPTSSGQALPNPFFNSLLGLPSFAELADVEIFGQELFVLGVDQLAIASLDGSRAAVTLPLPMTVPFLWGMAVGTDVLAVSTPLAFIVADRADGTWRWREPVPFPDQRNGHLLGMVAGDLLVSLPPLDATSTAPASSAELLRLSLDGDVITRFPTRRTANGFMKKDGGLLFTEHGNPREGLNTALEWLGPGETALRTLAEVPLRSATDSNGGAYASAVVDAGASGERLYVANGEGRLVGGTWSTDAMTLSQVPGPWNGDLLDLGPALTAVASSGDVLVVPGLDGVLYFLKACSK